MQRDLPIALWVKVLVGGQFGVLTRRIEDGSKVVGRTQEERSIGHGCSIRQSKKTKACHDSGDERKRIEEDGIFRSEPETAIRNIKFSHGSPLRGLDKDIADAGACEKTHLLREQLGSWNGRGIKSSMIARAVCLDWRRSKEYRAVTFVQGP